MAQQEKKMRSHALANFTRAVNTFNNLVDAKSYSNVVIPQFEKVQIYWEKLESAHESFIEKTDIDIDAEDDGLKYLDEPGERHAALLLKYSMYSGGVKDEEKTAAEVIQREKRQADEEVRKAQVEESKIAENERISEEKRNEFTSTKAEFIAAAEAFERLNVSLKGTLENVSSVDKRAELQKVETEFSSLKKRIIHLTGISGANDIQDAKDKFAVVEKLFVDTRKQMLSELKDTPLNSGGESSSMSSKSTKNEKVKLPSFKGDDRMSPFLKFPVWKEQWDLLIGDHEEKWWPTLLWDHIDDTARSKFVGWESSYKEAIKRLQRFYGDPLKVVACVMNEVRAPRPIPDGDYQGLVSYSVVLENNLNRLRSMKREHEMSNTTIMSEILRKFPRPVAEKWNEHLWSQEDDVQLQPFVEFVSWLESQRYMWERMLATEFSRRSARTFYGEPNDRTNAKTCYGCGEAGHFKRDCPKRSHNSNPHKPRGNTTVKKFWCALHKGDVSCKCFSNSCQELQRTEVSKRLQLLKDNGDCFHCCGDHKPEDCQRKERVCGGGKEDRGCTRSHNVHEMFCEDARCFAVVEVHSSNSNQEGVVLSIMRVQVSKSKMASVFWDLGCSSNFVREEFAVSCGFRGKEERLSVKTLGDVVTDYTVMEYTCFLKDLNGEQLKFKAYGMACITGEVTFIDLNKIKKLFPHISHNDAKKLTRLNHVDILIGMSHPSWHPERAERAKGGGDFWIYRGILGSCVGGRHPEIIDATRKSKSLFTVVHTYHARVEQDQHVSHHLEFCPRRVQKYKESNNFYQEQSAKSFCVTSESELIKEPSAVSTSHEQSYETSAICYEHCVGGDDTSINDTPGLIECQPLNKENEDVSIVHCVAEHTVDVIDGIAEKTVDVADGVAEKCVYVFGATVDATTIVAEGTSFVDTCVAEDTVDVANNVAGDTIGVPGHVAEEIIDLATSAAEGTVYVSTIVAEETIDIADNLYGETTELLDVVAEETADVVDSIVLKTINVAGGIAEGTPNVADRVAEETVGVAEETVGVAFGEAKKEIEVIDHDEAFVDIEYEEGEEHAEVQVAEGKVVFGLIECQPLNKEDKEMKDLHETVSRLNVMAEVFEPLHMVGIITSSNVMSNASEVIEHQQSAEIVASSDVTLNFTEVIEPQQLAGIITSSDTMSHAPEVIVPPQSDGKVTNSKDLSARTQCIVCHGNVVVSEDYYFKAESLGPAVEPKCGACKCSKCPIGGAKFCFKDQQDYDVIQGNLHYDEENSRWVTEYPWLCERSTLPKNDKAAMQNLLSLERRLSKFPEQAKEWCDQIKEMVNRGAAIVLPEDVVAAWEGDYYFLALVGVKGKKGWLRVCFDASRKQGGYPCFNQCMRKGPDCYVNNLLSVIILFRYGRVGCAADISKFHNRVYLEEKDIHMQRFYWRDLKTDQKPSVYAVVVNNFGVTAANCIATCALHKSADIFSEKYPIESEELKKQTYVDDMLMADANKEQALLKTSRLDEIGKHAGMPNKGWTYSGDKVSDGVNIGEEEDRKDEKVLGTFWIPETDMFVFKVSLKLKIKSGSCIDVTSITVLREHESELLLTRRTMLSNVSMIFDPVGFLAPILLEAKLLLRESWCVPGIGWDDPLPDEQAERWIALMSSLLNLKDVQFPRSLWPEGEVVGLPILVVFSDGAALAYGAVAYIRWLLDNGKYWSRIITSKCKIAPKHIVSVPRMELSGGLLGNRIKKIILKETNIQFARTYQFVDSSTVLGYVHKQCGVFGPYEGLRVAEIQSTNVLVDGKLVGWAWVSGGDNPADWCTKPRPVKDLIVGGFWEKGPDFLQEDEALWPIKSSYRTDRLEGEVVLKKKVVCSFVNLAHPDFLGRLLNRGSCLKKIIRVLAWMLRVIVKNIASNSLSAVELKEAKYMLIKYSQGELVRELKNAVEFGAGRFRKLAPVVDEDKIWRVGARIKNHVPFTFDSKMPVIVPSEHRLTLLAMEESHKFNHAGQDSTVSRFHTGGFWTIGAGRIAKKVKNDCVPCRKVAGKTQSQLCGEIPEIRLQQLVAWAHCQLDMFGPFSCRGDVNPRTTKKIWGLILEDVNSGAVHLDVVSAYSTVAVLTTMERFGSLRGWPGVIYSDPGSQLVSASGKLEFWWKRMEGPLATFAGSQNFRWETSPADSPWRQGKVERRIAIVKKLLRHAIGDSRLTPLELLTALMQIANICNERPITIDTVKPRDDGTYPIITPNHLMMGRSGKRLPDDTELSESLPMKERYRLINHVTTAFWQRWSTEVSPSLVIRQKWHIASRNMQEGDVVMIADTSTLKMKYKLGIVEDAKVSQDGLVRSAVIRYNNITQTPDNKTRSTPVRVTRSIQRLILVLPVEEQSSRLMVKEDDHQSVVCAYNQ